MSQSIKFRLTSGGAAYNLDVGYESTEVEVINETKWATDGTKVKFTWHKGMANGYALSEIADDTGINRAIETTNGFTPYDESAVTANYQTVTGITSANPGVVTVASTTGWSAGDAVRFQDIVGMVELNKTGRPIYIKEILGATTFSIEDTSSYTAYTSGGTVYNLSKDVTAEGFKGITLGSTVMGVDGDILSITAKLADFYKDLGDIGA